jgi:hypothetical protein
MTNPFVKASDKLVKRMGEKWLISGSVVPFYGIFDAENKLQTDNSGQDVIIAGSTVTVTTPTVVLYNLAYGRPITRVSDGAVWLVRESLKVDDGLLTRISIMDAVTNIAPYWSGSTQFTVQTALSASYALSSSYSSRALNADSSSYVLVQNVQPGSFPLGNFTFPANMIVLGTASIGFAIITGSIQGSASYAETSSYSVSSSYAPETFLSYDVNGDIVAIG